MSVFTECQSMLNQLLPNLGTSEREKKGEIQTQQKHRKDSTLNLSLQFKCLYLYNTSQIWKKSLVQDSQFLFQIKSPLALLLTESLHFLTLGFYSEIKKYFRMKRFCCGKCSDLLFPTEMKCFVIKERAKYQKRVLFDTSTESQVPVTASVSVQMWTVPNPTY